MTSNEKINTHDNRLLYPALCISALFMLIPAFYNYYPLVNPDTGTYLASGFKPETPFDRPITYGLLVRLFSLNGLSLWPVVYVQALMVSALLFKVVGYVAGEGASLLRAMGIILFLAICTPLSWIVSQVQPDVFTTIALLCIVLLLMDKKEPWGGLALYVLFFVAVAVHMSHPMLFVILLIGLFLFKRLFCATTAYRKINKKIALLVILSLSSIIIMGAALSKSKHVFFTGSLLEKGVLKKYLDENCATKNYKLCAYKDSLPVSADIFWWDSNSPLYKIGGWKGTKAEFNDIIHNTLTTPEYLELYLAATARQACTQAQTFNIGDGNQSFQPGSNVEQRVAEYFPNEINKFHKAKQNNRDIAQDLWLPNRLFSVVFCISLAIILVVLVRLKYATAEMKLLLIVCLAGIVLNYLDCAAFTVVNGRYGCKMIWLLPFCILLNFITPKAHAASR